MEEPNIFEIQEGEVPESRCRVVFGLVGELEVSGDSDGANEHWRMILLFQFSNLF